MNALDDDNDGKNEISSKNKNWELICAEKMIIETDG